MIGFVIMVDFRLKPGAKASFRRLINDNARASCRDEPGCRRFDVMESPSEVDRIVLYEIYDDRAAFGAHKDQPFREFQRSERGAGRGQESDGTRFGLRRVGGLKIAALR